MKQQLQGPVIHRAAPLDRGGIDQDKRTIEISFSSKQPVIRSEMFDDDWTEILGHEPDHVDLSRLQGSAPVLYDHGRFDNRERLGVVKRAWLDGDVGRAEIQISKRDDVEGFWRDIEDGILSTISVGYLIHERTLQTKNQDAPDEYLVTRWEPYELSFAPIPADITVGVGRNENNSAEKYRILNINPAKAEKTEGKSMSEDKERKSPEEKPVEIKQETQTREINLENENKRAIDDYKAQEKQRKQEIRTIFAAFNDKGHENILNDCLDDDAITSDQARAKLLDAIASQPAGDQTSANTVRIEAGQDKADKFRDAVLDNVLVRSGLVKPEKQDNEYRGLSLRDLAAHSLRMSGISVPSRPLEIVGRAFTATTDYPNVMLDAANKSMLMGWEEEETTWQKWCATGSVSDFKPSNRVGLSAFPNLPVKAEGAAYTFGTVDDTREQVLIATYGRMFGITREAVINDDLSALTVVPRRMGQAAARTVNTLPYAVLTANANLADGFALFDDANHGNLKTGAMSEAVFDTMRVAMRKQTDYSGAATLNITPTYMLVPVALETLGKKWMAAQFIPGTPDEPNPFNNAFEVVTESLLDADSATAFYLSARSGDTIEVAFLNGQTQPFFDNSSEAGWSVDGVETKVRIDAGAKALDFRGLQKSTGV